MSDPGEALRRAVEVMRALRAPDGCPWDREQTHETLERYLIEESYETIEAIDSGDPDALRDELADLTLQVLFHAQIAAEDGAFTVADVLDHLTEKLIRRHPHVFGDVVVSSADEVVANWERNKREERGSGVTEGVPTAMPALARASALRRRAVQAGMPPGDAHARVRALAGGEDIGELLLAVVALAAERGVEPEHALRRAADRLARGVRAAEASGRDLASLSAEEWAEYLGSV